MKSAYELAMERLQKQAPTVALRDDQRKEIADIDQLYRAKIAEREVFLKGEIAKAADPAETAALEKQLSLELRRLRDDCEDKKDQVRRKG